jgi:hypothetical protein
VKNGIEREVALNKVAKSVIEECRGRHREFVFTEEEPGGKAIPGRTRPSVSD